MRLVVSPHLDDAVLGAGQYLALTREPVLTVFDGAPAGDRLTDYDKAGGFLSSVDAMATRTAENDEALAVLGCAGVGLGWLDLQYDDHRLPKGTLARLITSVMEQKGCEGLVVPLGIQHPDHVYVADACLMLATTGIPVWLYEELPYRVVWPETAWRRHEALRWLGWELVPDLLGAGPIEAKEAAVRCYKSQELDIHCCLVPERHWVPRR